MVVRIYPVPDVWGGGTKTVKIIALVRNLSGTTKHYKMYVNGNECSETYTLDHGIGDDLVFTTQIDFPVPTTPSVTSLLNIRLLECYDASFINCREHYASMAVRVFNPNKYTLMASPSWSVVWRDGIWTGTCIDANYAGGATPTTNKGGGIALASDTYIVPPYPIEDIIYAEYVAVVNVQNTTYLADPGLRWALLLDRLSGRYVTTYFLDNNPRNLVLPLRYELANERHHVSLKLVIWGNPLTRTSTACINYAQIYARYITT